MFFNKRSVDAAFLSAVAVYVLCFSSVLVAGYTTREDLPPFPHAIQTDLPPQPPPWRILDKAAGSCKDECDAVGVDTSRSCQCNAKCMQHGDCCWDYETECLSCEGRCHFSFDRHLPCQCNSKCNKYKNCCKDYSQFCRHEDEDEGPTDRVPVTDNELSQLSEAIFELEGPNNAAGSVRVNLGNRTYFNSTIDRTSTPLLQVQTNAYRKPTIAKLLPLHNNYVAPAATAEVVTTTETSEETQFLDAIVATPIMRKAEDFLVSKGFIQRQRRVGGILRNNPNAMKEALQQIWFGMYNRQGSALGSSGFEHVFLGETKNGEVSGFHNWVFFSTEESKNNVNYYGHVRSINLGTKGSIIKHNFKWLTVRKPISTMFIGTSPEFEMALYTICFYSRPGQRCPVVLGGKHISISTHYLARQGRRYVASAYPDI